MVSMSASDVATRKLYEAFLFESAFEVARPTSTWHEFVLAAAVGASACARADPCQDLALAAMPPMLPVPPLGSESRRVTWDDSVQDARDNSMDTKLPNILLLTSVVALIPGLTLTLFSAKAVQTISVPLLGSITIPVMEFSKSTLGTVQHLAVGHYFLPAGLIIFFSIAIPAGKTAIMAAVGASRRRSSRHLKLEALTFVRKISKWAHVDALCAATLAGGLGGAVPQLNVVLNSGFYCFVSYCLLSTSAAVAADPASSFSINPPSVTPGDSFETVDALMGIGTSVAAACVVFNVVTTPVLSLAIPAFAMQSQNLSVLDIAMRLFRANESFASLYVLAGTCVIPALDLAAAALRMGSSRSEVAKLVRQPALVALGDFALLDVFLASLILTRLAASGLSGNISVNLVPQGMFPLVAYVILRLAVVRATLASESS